VTDAPYSHELKLGDSMAPLTFTVTRVWNQQFCLAQDDFDPRYLVNHDGQPPQVHPGLLLSMSANTKSPSFRLAPGTGSVLARQTCRFVHPATVEQELTVKFDVVEVYERNNRRFQVVESTVTDAGGRVNLRRQSHLTFVNT
jgi:hypothetical protein